MRKQLLAAAMPALALICISSTLTGSERKKSRAIRAPIAVQTVQATAQTASGGSSGTIPRLCEALKFHDCYAGPDAVPAPSPTGNNTTETCLATFDYNLDGDVDHLDYASVTINATAAPAPVCEFGFSFGEPYRLVTGGDPMPVYSGFQGGTHMFITIRVAGIAPGTDVWIQRSGVMVDDGSTAVFEFTFGATLADDGTGGAILESAVIPLYFIAPGSADGRLADLTFTVTAMDDDCITATITQRVLLDEV